MFGDAVMAGAWVPAPKSETVGVDHYTARALARQRARLPAIELRHPAVVIIRDGSASRAAWLGLRFRGLLM